MAKSRAQKQELVAKYRELIRASQAIYLVKPDGVTPNEAATLKKELFDIDSSFNVVKNSLFKIALKEEGLPELDTLNNGQHGALFSSGEVTEAAKLLLEFIEKNEKMEILIGVLNGEQLSAEQVAILGKLPSKEQLIGQLLSVFIGPVRGLATIVTGNMRELVQVINAIKENKSI